MRSSISGAPIGRIRKMGESLVVCGAMRKSKTDLIT